MTKSYVVFADEPARVLYAGSNKEHAFSFKPKYDDPIELQVWFEKQCIERYGRYPEHDWNKIYDRIAELEAEILRKKDGLLADELALHELKQSISLEEAGAVHEC